MLGNVRGLTRVSSNCDLLVIEGGKVMGKLFQWYKMDSANCNQKQIHNVIHHKKLNLQKKNGTANVDLCFTHKMIKEHTCVIK